MLSIQDATNHIFILRGGTWWDRLLCWGRAWQSGVVLMNLSACGIRAWVRLSDYLKNWSWNVQECKIFQAFSVMPQLIWRNFKTLSWKTKDKMPPGPLIRWLMSALKGPDVHLLRSAPFRAQLSKSQVSNLLPKTLWLQQNNTGWTLLPSFYS